MIVRPRPNWLRMLFVLRGSILRDIAPQLLFTLVFAVLVTSWQGELFHRKVTLTFVPFSLIGVTLAIFLGFRNSTSYARFWEARVLWGSLLNETRSLARQALTLVDDPADVRTVTRRLSAVVHALRHQLRGTDPRADFERLLSEPDRARLAPARFKPAVLTLMVGEWFRQARRDGRLAPVLAPAIEEHLARLTEAFGGCERLANTPIPFTYAIIIHRTIYIYCLLLPFGLIDSLGAMTPVIVVFIAYTFFALEALGAEIEEPFGTAPNDLALDALSWSIEASLCELVGDEQVPPQPEPHQFLLT
jgi:putative membrane protein